MINKGQFKKGQHWREPKPHWEKKWLLREYVTKKRSTGEIAQEVGTTDANILYWLRKHKIPRRTVSEARSIKHWGVAGEANPMFGRTGNRNYNWKGGCTPERQAFYVSREWAIACSAVWKRDKARCRRCSKPEQEGKLHVHHIVPFMVVKLRAAVSNLILLCTNCHRWVHSKKNTEKEFIKNHEK